MMAHIKALPTDAAIEAYLKENLILKATQIRKTKSKSVSQVLEVGEDENNGEDHEDLIFPKPKVSIYLMYSNYLHTSYYMLIYRI